MLFVDVLLWWYVRGWSWVATYFFVLQGKKISELFSMGDLLRTLFSPYRQTFAGRVDGGVGDKFRGLIDQTVSRVIGFLVRFVLLVTGTIAWLFNMMLGGISVILWPLVPALPLLAFILLFMELGNAV